MTASQTGDPLQYVADLQDIAVTDPQRRRVTDPSEAAELLRAESLERVKAVCTAQSGAPVVLLSGGVDSIFVAAAAVEAGLKPHAITVVTRSGSTDKANAEAAAESLGLVHTIVELDELEIAQLARTAVDRLPVPELWEVSYAIPLLAAANALDRLPEVGPILTGNAADAILAGGRTLTHPLASPEATEELDRIIRAESAANFRRERLVPDFHERVIPQYASRFVHFFQTVRFWDLATQFAPTALFREVDGQIIDKIALRLACELLLPADAGALAWAKKSAIQKSAGIMGALSLAARQAAADLPGARTYTNPLEETWEAVATRLFLALLRDTDRI
ncbi:asparagine synthase C-terminal domain-containing protein [Nocardia africana]